MASIVKKFSFIVSDGLREREFVETGREGGYRREVEVELDTPSLREAWALLRGVGSSLYSIDEADRVKGDWSYKVEGEPSFEEAPTVEQLKQVLLARAERFRQVAARRQADMEVKEAERARKQALAEPLLAEINRLSEAGDLEALEALRVPKELADFVPSVPGEFSSRSGMADRLRDARTAVKQQRATERARQAEAEMGEWIKENGSDHLKRAFGMGYKVHRLYTLERVAKEFPGFTCDFQNKAEWKSRLNPSPAELDAVEAVQKKAPDHEVKVVWLTAPPVEGPDPDSDQIGEDEYNDYDEYDFQKCPAIVIRDYLGKYDLIWQL